MKNLFIYLTFIFAIVLLFGFAYSFNPENGKSIFVDKKCVSCHSVEAAGIESKKKDAVDLSNTGDKFDAEFIAKFLVKEEKIDDKEHKMVMKGSEEEIKTVAEWLASLKSEEK